MSNVSAEIKVHPGKELLALDFAEIMDASLINSGIIQGCDITLESGVLKMASGRIMIKGRLGLITGGDIELPSISTEADCKLLAVCDLRADTPFYVRLVSNAEYETLSADADRYQDTFNVGSGVAFVDLGTAHVNPATSVVTSWTPSANAAVKKDAKSYAAIQQSIADHVAQINRTATAQHTLLTQKINAWATYLQNRAFASSKFVQEEIVVPSWTVPAGARIACQFPAIRGTTIRATGTNSRTETRPSWQTFTQTYTTLSDNTKVPLNVDSATVRYVAVGLTGVLITDAAYQNKGKNAGQCVVSGWNISGADYSRRCYVYVKNTGTAEAIIDLTANLEFVRRG